MSKWHVILTQDEDGDYTAEVTGMYGCLAGGHTIEEALANIKDAMYEFLAEAVENVNEMPRDYVASVHIVELDDDTP